MLDRDNLFYRLRVTLKCGTVFVSEGHLAKDWAERLARQLRRCRNVAQVEVITLDDKTQDAEAA
jgi:hypothetical protein